MMERKRKKKNSHIASSDAPVKKTTEY